MSTRNVKAGGAYIEILARDEQAMRSLTNVSNRMKAMGKLTQQMGRQMMAAGAIAAAGITPVIATLANFEDKMSAVAAVSGASREDLARLEQQARQLGATTSFSASQVAEAMQFLAMAGFNTEQILSAIPSVLNLARAGAVDLGVAADIASDVGQAFGLTADEIQRVADVMAATASQSNTSIQMLGETFKYAAPLAAAAGQSIETAAAAAGILGNNGIKASMAGTDLALILKKLADSKLQETLRAMGVETLTADGRIRNLTDIMQDLDAAMAGMGEAERLAWMASNFDRAAKSAQILTSQNQQLHELAGAIGQASGEAARMADTMDDNVGGKLRALMSALEGAMIDLGKALVPVLEPLLKDLTAFLGQLGEWINNNQQLAQDIANMVVLTAEFGVGLYAAGTALSVAGAAVAALSVSMTSLSASSTAAAGPLAAFVALAAAATIGVYRANDAIKEYNASMAEAAQLNQQLQSRQKEQHQTTLEQTRAIDDQAEREKFLREEIERRNKEIQGMENSVKSAQKQVDELNTTWNSFTGNKVLAEANSELENHEQRLKLARKQQMELYQEMQQAEKQKGQVIPGTQARDDMESQEIDTATQSQRESFARSIEEMTKSPLEKFDEFMEQLGEALDRGDINQEQFDRAHDQKRKETMRALEREVEDNPLQSFADQINDQMKTPLQRFEERMRDVNQALADGLIDQEVVNQFRQQELENLDRALSLDERASSSGRRGSNTAIDINSAEGLAAIANAALRPGSQEERNGKALQNISDEMVASNTQLQMILRELRDSQIVKESRFSGGGQTV